MKAELVFGTRTVIPFVLLIMLIPVTSGSATGAEPPWIEIVGDDAFLASGAVMDGSGTESDPYVLDGISLTDGGSEGLLIQSTTRHFVVTNCSLSGKGEGAGIVLRTVRNGTFRESAFSDRAVSFDIEDSFDITIERSDLSKCAIAVERTQRFSLLDCECANLGLQIWSSSGGSVSNNELSSGYISIFSTDHLSIEGNVIYSTVELSRCSNMTIGNNTIDPEVSLYATEYSNINSNRFGSSVVLDICGSNHFYGNEHVGTGSTAIGMTDSNMNFIKFDSITSFSTAISIQRGRRNEISGCKIEDNDLGLSLEMTSGNLIVDNIFDNGKNLQYDECGQTWCNAPNKSKNVLGGPWNAGNFWSDYNGTDTNHDGIGDTDLPYGPGDSYPLVRSDREIIIQDKTVNDVKWGTEHLLSFWIASPYTWATLDWEVDTIFYGTGCSVIDNDRKSGTNLYSNGFVNHTVIVPENTLRMDYSISVTDTSGHMNSFRGTALVVKPDPFTVVAEVGPIGVDAEVFANISITGGQVKTASAKIAYDDFDNLKDPLCVKRIDESKWTICFMGSSERVAIVLTITDMDGGQTQRHLGWYAIETKTSVPNRIKLISSLGAHRGECYQLSFLVDGEPYDKIELSLLIGQVALPMEVSIKDGHFQGDGYIGKLAPDASVRIVATEVDGTSDTMEMVLELGRLDVSGSVGFVPVTPATGSLVGLGVDHVARGIVVRDLEYSFDDGVFILVKGGSSIVSVPESAKSLTLRAKIADEQGSTAYFSKTYAVIDSIYPQIVLDVSPPLNGEICTVEADFKDNIGVIRSSVTYAFDRGNIVRLNLINGTGKIFVCVDAAKLTICCEAIDASGLRSYFNITPLISDGIVPEIANVDYSLDGDVLTVNADVRDNRGLSGIICGVHGSDWVMERPMEGEGVRHFARFTLPRGGGFTFFIEARDPSGNVFRSGEIKVEKEKEFQGVLWGVGIGSLIGLGIVANLGIFMLRKRGKKYKDSSCVRPHKQDVMVPIPINPVFEYDLPEQIYIRPEKKMADPDPQNRLDF